MGPWDPLGSGSRVRDRVRVRVRVRVRDRVKSGAKYYNIPFESSLSSESNCGVYIRVVVIVIEI